jgi:hypothetical protein
MPKRTFRFLQYSIHAHIESGNPDYPSLLLAPTLLQGKHHRNGKRVTAIGKAALTTAANGKKRLFLIVYTGDDDQSILFYDLNQLAEFSSFTEAGRFVARKTHVLIDPTQRTLLIESGRGHISAEELAQFIEDEAQKVQEFKGLDLSFTPVPTRAFADKIMGMTRIQQATVSLARPNVSWNDRHAQLTQFADESNARAIDATVRAGRNESLSKQTGFVPDLVQWLTQTLPSVVNAKIKGSMDDQSPLTELKLSDNVETVALPIELNPETKQPLDTVIEERLNAHLNSRETGND